MKIRSLLTLLFVCLLLPLTPQTGDAAIFTPTRGAYGTPVTVHVDGRYVGSEVAPLLTNGRVFLPMRAAAEMMGANVAWDGQTRCISVAKGGTIAYFFADSTTYYVNDAARTSDAAPVIQNGRTLLPVRVFAEALGAQVDWHSDMLDVAITTGATTASGPDIPAVIPANLRPAIEKFYVQPTKPGIGSWYCVYDWSGETYIEANFIAECPDDSRQCVQLFAKDILGDANAEFMTLWRDPVTDYGSSCVLHRRGMESHIYESDTTTGFTFTYPSNDTYNYGNAFDADGLERIHRDNPSMDYATGNNIFTAF